MFISSTIRHDTENDIELRVGKTLLQLKKYYLFT